jgi:hypothetical protein
MYVGVPEVAGPAGWDDREGVQRLFVRKVHGAGATQRASQTVHQVCEYMYAVLQYHFTKFVSTVKLANSEPANNALPESSDGSCLVWIDF